MATLGFDTSGTLNVASNSTATTSVTVASTAHRYMFLESDSIVSASYAGVAFSLITTFIPVATGGANPGPAINIWGLANPASGTNTLSITGGGNPSITYGATYVVYNGADPVQPPSYNTFAPFYGPGNQYSTSVSTSITTTVDKSWVLNFIMWVAGNGHSVVTPSAGVLRVQGGSSYGQSIFDSNAQVTPTGTYNFTGTTDSGSVTLSSVTYEVKPYLTFGFSGPASGNVGSASTNFTVTPDVAINGTVTVTPSGTAAAGMSPITLTFSNSATPQTFTITPTATAGIITLNLSSNCGLNNPTPIFYTSVATVPAAPTVGTASPGNASATVGFTANSNGGNAVTQFRAISTPGSLTGTGTTSPLTVNGLSNGTAYTFTVRATNAIGNSVESSASNSITPFVPATTFTLTGPSSGNVRSASTNFTITPNAQYDGTITITPSGAGSTGIPVKTLTWVASSAAQTFTITPQTSGVITLTPSNSKSITNPANLTYTAVSVVPTAPVIGLASKGNTYADVSVSAPANDGGATVTRYTVTSSPAGITGTGIAPGVIRVLGLTNGTSYTFTATCTNSVGVSAASSVSNAVTPSADANNFTNSGPKFNLTSGEGEILTF